MKSIIATNLGSTTTYFVGNYYEVANGVVTKYYYAGAQRIAMRTGGTLNYILGDHLGSTSLVASSAGTVVSQQYYKTWGEVRYASATLPTKYTFTGQYSHVSDFGLMFYNARWYDPALGRFAQADSIIPGGVQGLDRYAYGLNNPLMYVDPSGHESGTMCDRGYCDSNGSALLAPNNGSRLSDFGITIGSGYSSEDEAQALAAAQAFGNALVHAKGAGNIGSLFKNVFGPMTFTMDKDDSGLWHCEAKTDGFGCTNAYGKLDSRIIVHELAHVFRNRYFSRMGKTSDVDLYTVIGSATITDATGNYVTGVHVGDDGVSKWERTFSGYQSDRVPHVYHGKEWPKDGTNGWNQTGEEFADMFMNWTYDSFSADNAGTARNEWMNNHMTTWMTNFP